MIIVKVWFDVIEVISLISIKDIVRFSKIVSEVVIKICLEVVETITHFLKGGGAISTNTIACKSIFHRLFEGGPRVIMVIVLFILIVSFVYLPLFIRSVSCTIGLIPLLWSALYTIGLILPL